MEKLSQRDFIREIGKKAGFAQEDIRLVFKALEDVLIEEIKDGNSVKLCRGVVFEPVQRAERYGRNLTTGEKIPVPAHKSVRVKITESFKEAIK